MPSYFQVSGQATKTCGLAVHNRRQSSAKIGLTATAHSSYTILCAQSRSVIRRDSTPRPPVVHAQEWLNTSGVRTLIPTIHTAYNKHDEVYIK